MIQVSGPVVWEVDVDTGLHVLLEPCAMQLDFEAPIVPRGYVPFMYVERRADGLWMGFDPGFQWDGASGPTDDDSDGSWDWPPLGHDGGYRLIRRGLWPESHKGKVDKQFRRMLRERPPKPPAPLPADAPWWKRWLVRPLIDWPWYGVKRAVRPLRARVWYRGVDVGGGDAAKLATPERHVGT
jgi:hypothetical protein